MKIRAYETGDVSRMNEIWNAVVEEGVAFPQEELLTAETGAAFFCGTEPLRRGRG